MKWVSAEELVADPIGKAARSNHVAVWCTSEHLHGASWVGGIDADDLAFMERTVVLDERFTRFDTILDARYFTGQSPEGFSDWVRRSKRYEASRRGRLLRQLTLHPSALHLAAMSFGFNALLRPKWKQLYAATPRDGCFKLGVSSAADIIDEVTETLLRAQRALTVLTSREREIVLLVIEGYSDLNIASRLNLAEATIGSHLNRAFKKLRVHSRAELVAACRDLTG